MHRILACLLFISAFAGLGSRVLMQPMGAETVCVPVEMSCDGHGHDHDPDHEAPSEDSHGPECPSTPHHHHHHGVQCSTGLLVMDEAKNCRLPALYGERTQWRHGDEPAPEGPVFTMDKPPLI